MTLTQIALALAVFAGYLAFNTSMRLDKKTKEIEHLTEWVDRLTWMVKDLDPQFEEERNILAAETPERGVDGWALIQIEKRKRAEGKPLYSDPIIPHAER